MQKKRLSTIRLTETAPKETSLKLPAAEKRTRTRIQAALAAKVTIKDRTDNQAACFHGRTIDLHEEGARIILNSPLPLSSSVDIRFGPSRRYGDFQAEASPLWTHPSCEDGGFQTGLRFLKIEAAYLPALKKILEDYKLLDTGFAMLVQTIHQNLRGIKELFDDFDREDNEEKNRIDFIETNKRDIFERLDGYFNRVWEIIKGFEKDRYIIHQDYYQQVLGYLLLDLIETNRHVYRKPLGYSGDYTMMNYIYDYHRDNYLGKSSYEKLINNYTCNIPISCSNIKRKDFLKERILRTSQRKDGAGILSVGSGPARELTELLKEGKINKPLVFKCLDPEKLALDYIESTINGIDPLKKRTLSIEYICKNVISLIRDRELKKTLQNQDFIYAFGIFDYLSDRIASKLTGELVQLLANEGELIIFNISSRKNTYRAYYELLGEWNMIHRVEEQMLAWTEEMNGLTKVKFEELPGDSNYLCLSITKTTPEKLSLKPFQLKQEMK